MYAIDLNTCTAIDVIKRSIVCHPSLFAEALNARQAEDNHYAAIVHSENKPAVWNAIKASASAAQRACEYVESAEADPFESDMGAGIIALNIACKLQCLPAHVRTASALRTWPE